MNRVKFGDVVQEIKINVDRTTDDHEYFIAGEHMDSSNIHITRRGRFSESDVGPAFIRLFRPGQVLYGSRRTYLRKVAVADFEGITSNTTFVLETKDSNRLLQELLPYIMLTDRFSEYAINNSKGSTNPYILFKDLAAYEFDLPTIEEQRQLMVLLSACDRAKEAYKRLLKQTDEVVKSQFIEMIQPLLDAGKTVPLDDLVVDDRPITYGILKPGSGFHGGIPVVKVKDMRDGVIDQSDLLLTTPELDYQYRRSRLRAGDLLISIRGSVGRMAEVPENLENANITQDTARLTIKPEYNKVYVRGVLESQPLQHDMEKNIRGVAVKGINIGYLRKLGIPMCDREAQDRLAALYQQSDKSKFELTQAISRIDDMIKALMQC